MMIFSYFIQSCRWLMVTKGFNFAVQTLFLLSMCIVTYSKKQVEEERLIGWKGESYHSKLCWGKRTQCYGVNAQTARKTNHFGIRSVTSDYLYRYDTTGQDPTYAHMAMIEALPNGTIIAMWQAGTADEGTKDQHFMSSYSIDSEATEWSRPARLGVIGGNGFALWGPVLFSDAVSNSLWLFYSENTGACHSNYMDWPPGGNIMAVTLDLSKQIWGEPRLLLAQEDDEGIAKVTANKPVEMSSGAWLLPFWRERALVGKSKECLDEIKGKGGAGVLRSLDRGQTWESLGFLEAEKTWLIENAIAEIQGGVALMVFRTQLGRIYSSTSADDGASWSPAAPLADLPNPNSKVDLIRINPGGELALVYNNHAKARSKVKSGALHYQELLSGGCKKCRTFLTVALSTDGQGAKWKEVATIETEVGETLRMHYPTLLQRGCELFVVYSRFYKAVVNSDDPNFPTQGIKLARVQLCGKLF